MASKFPSEKRGEVMEESGVSEPWTDEQAPNPQSQGSICRKPGGGSAWDSS